MTMLKMLGLSLIALPLLVLLCGQLGLFAGRTPNRLGVQEGLLKPPSRTPNSVSSQARLHPDHPRHLQAQIAPLTYQGDGAVALKRLSDVVNAMERTRLMRQEANYLHFEFSSRWLKFTDDVEFFLDDAAKEIQVRSSSRLGRRDYGVNRARIEAIRKLLTG